jgi:SAM-dependent methyltransferase
VTLFDLSPQNIALANAKLAESGLKAENIVVGDGRDLSALNGQRFDAILTLGPVYHLTERAERIAFLRTARSLLTPDGILIAAYLNAWGIARSLLSDAPAWFDDPRNLDRLLIGADFTGARACSGFTECSWSTPDQAGTEIREAGFALLEEAGAEGFAGGLRREIEAIAKDDRAAFNHVVAFAVRTSGLPQYPRATDHLLLAARPGGPQAAL